MTISTAYIEITDKCNLNCKTCYNGSGTKTINCEMPFETFKKALNVFRPYGLKRVLISGGEPSLHSEFDSYIDFIRTNNEMEFGIVTNGTSRNKKFLDLLSSESSLTLQVSLDGSCEEVNKHIRGAGNFSRVQEFLSMPRSRNVKALLKMVVTKYNHYDIEDYYKLALKYNCQVTYDTSIIKQKLERYITSGYEYANNSKNTQYDPHQYVNYAACVKFPEYLRETHEKENRLYPVCVFGFAEHKRCMGWRLHYIADHEGIEKEYYNKYKQYSSNVAERIINLSSPEISNSGIWIILA